MITCDCKSNIGCVFDVNLNVFYDDDRCDSEEIKDIMIELLTQWFVGMDMDTAKIQPVYLQSKRLGRIPFEYMEEDLKEVRR